MRRLKVHSLGGLIFVLATLFSSAPLARAATINVNSTLQQGAGTGAFCTLGAAILAANNDVAVDACTPGFGDDTIILPAGTYTLTVAASFGDLGEAIGLPLVTSNIIVEGQGASTTFIERSGAAPDFRIFEQSGFSLGTLTIRKVTIRGGKSSLGGAIFAGGNGLIVEDAAFDNNSTTAGDGGAIHQGNPIFPVVGGTVVTISGSTFEGNSAANLGGALFTQAFTSAIKNSTFSGNSAAGGGAIATAFDAVTVDFNNVTITDNHASGVPGVGGGIFDPNSLFGPSPTQFKFRNTILAGNTATGGSPECAAVLNSQGHNIVQQEAGCTIIIGAAVGDLFGVDPLLGALANNGGGTKTHPLLSGSPAIEAGDPGVPGSGGTACEATDQRGVARPIDGNLNGIPVCDIGAFEAAEGSAAAVIVVNETITVSDAPQVTPPAVINVAEVILVSDAPFLLPAALINVVENILVSDVPKVTPPAVINVAEIIQVSDAPTLTTPPNTPVGNNVGVQPVDSTTGNKPVTLTFSNVTQTGVTTLTTSSSGPPPPKGFKLGDPPVYFDLTTTALFSGSVTVCIDYSGITFRNPSQIKLFHLEDGVWVDRTVSVDTVNKIICASVTSFSLFAIFEPASRPVIAVANQNDDTVSIIDPETNQVVRNIEVGHKPDSASFFDVFIDGFTAPAKLYVSQRKSEVKKGKGDDKDDDDEDDEDDDEDGGKGSIEIVVGPASPTENNALDFSSTKTVEVGKRPEGLAVRPDGSQLWVTNRNGDSISIIDRATEKVIATVPLKKKIPSKGKGKGETESTIGRKPVAVGFSPDGLFAYVAGRNSNNLIVLDTAKAVTDSANAILAAIDVGSKPVALAVDPARSLVYVANRSGNNVAVVDVSNPSAPLLKAKIAVGEEPEGVALLHDDSKLYVTNGESNSVSVLQVQSGSPYLTLIAIIPVGRQPSGLALTPPGTFSDKPFAYIANREDDTVSVIDTTTDQVIAVIPVGKGPRGVAGGLVPTAP